MRNLERDNMKKIDRDVAQKAFEEFYTPKATDKRLGKAEALKVIKKALEEYGIASLTGKYVEKADSPFDLFFYIGGEEVKVHLSNPGYPRYGSKKYLSDEEFEDLAFLQRNIDNF